MLKIGDKVKIIKSLLPEKHHERVGDFNLTYKIEDIDDDSILAIISNSYHTWNLNAKYLELDYNYYRKMKIKKICSKLEK